MVDIKTLPESLQGALTSLECPTFEAKPWVRGGALAERRVAMVSSAGLNLHGDDLFAMGDGSYRAIPHGAEPNEILMSHISVNFDRTAFQQDLNTVLPRDRLDELAGDGVIGSVASTHYSFMGATDPAEMEAGTRELAGILKTDAVDTVLLVPV